MTDHFLMSGGDNLAGGTTVDALTETTPKTSGDLEPADCQAQRNSLGWSLHDLALRSGFALTTLSEFEAGRRKLGLSAQVALRRVLKKGMQNRVQQP
jgi:DNA-binding transcriptional regulator YiaG